MTEKVWFISGASRGFGRIWTEAALARGDRVAPTARNVSEPGSFATNFVTPSSLKIAHGYDVYEALRERMFAYGAQLAFGDPYSTTEAIMKIVDAKEPPLRVFLGTEGLPAVKSAYMARLEEWEKWADISNAAQGESCQMSVVNNYRKADWATE